MAVEPVGATLASIALIFPLYDACNRIWSSWQVRRSFGQDLQTHFRRLEIQWVHLYLLLERRQGALVDPPDPDDKQHRITRVILRQLSCIKELFEQCDDLIRKNCGPRKFLTCFMVGHALTSWP